MFGKKSNENEMVKIDAIHQIQRNGNRYTQVSYWSNNTRYSTLVDGNIKLPQVGEIVKRSDLRWTGIPVQTMKKQEHRINGFIDRGTLKVGDRMKFLDDQGRWCQTSPITRIEVAGSNVYVETANSIYVNYDRTQSQTYEQTQVQNLWQHQQPQYQPPTLERAIAERCLDNGKNPKVIGGYDINKLIMQDQSGQRWYITPNQVKPGMHIQLECTMKELETGRVSSGLLDIPNVQDFAYQNGRLIIESRSSTFTNVNFSKEYHDLKMERGYAYLMNFERS